MIMINTSSKSTAYRRRIKYLFSLILTCEACEPAENNTSNTGWICFTSLAADYSGLVDRGLGIPSLV